MTDSIRVQNLRSIADSGKISLRPITILVGANSSGKSTFLRTFPLLRQSAETETSNAILWYGRYVDFGSFDETVRRGTTEPIVFEFETRLPPDPVRRPFGPRAGLRKEATTIVSFGIAKSPLRDSSFVKHCALLLFGKQIRIDFNDAGAIGQFKIDDISLKTEYLVIDTDRQAVFLPSVSARFKFMDPKDPESLTSHNMITEDLLRHVKRFFHGNTSEETIASVVYQLRPAPTDSLLQSLKYASDVPSWRSNTGKLTVDSVAFREIETLVWARWVPGLLRAADAALASFAAKVTYMGPFRASAQRYYRVQDLAVDEIDYRGENLAMFLRSLSERDRKDFSDFLNRYFSVWITPRSIPGHMTILIRRTNSDAEINLADMGFGYSQLLPVVAQIWSAIQSSPELPIGIDPRENTPSPALVAIEQPELHLHPASQARLGDLLVGSVSMARERGRDVRFLVETHSEAVVNRIGELIREQKVSAEDIQICVFDEMEVGQKSRVTIATYDATGALLNWPFGFFAPALSE